MLKSASTPVRAADFLALRPHKQRTQRILFCVTEIIRINSPMRFPALISFFLLCCGLASGCRDGITRQVAARVLSMHGPVVFGIEEQTDFRPVTPESRIHDGDIVRTLDRALLNVALIPAALAQMSSNSEIKVEELRISKDGNQTGDGMRGRSARIRLSGGKVTVLFSQRGNERAVQKPRVGFINLCLVKPGSARIAVFSEDRMRTGMPTDAKTNNCYAEEPQQQRRIEQSRLGRQLPRCHDATNRVRSG